MKTDWNIKKYKIPEKNIPAVEKKNIYVLRILFIIALVFGLEFPSARKRTIEQGYLKQLLDVTFSASENQEKYLKMKKSVEDFLFEYE